MALTSQEDLAGFVEIINEIRRDPFSSAEVLGYDRNELAETNPWLKASYVPCVVDEFLCAMAVAHNRPGGEILEPEMSPAYDYVRTGETGGVVAFFNFLPQKTVFRIIVEDILKQELASNPERVGGLNLFSPEFTRVGIAMEAGVEVIGGKRQNAYFVTIRFGSLQLKSEMQVLTMVNQVRARPVTVEKYLGASFFELLSRNTNYLSEWFKVYPPLMGNSILHAAAQGYSKQLADLDLDLEPSPLVRALDAGYEGFEVTESIASGESPIADVTSAQIANTVFQSLIHDELAAAPERGGVFSLESSDGGVGISFASVDDLVYIASALDAGMATGDDDGQAGIYGAVYFDTDGNNVYTPGEEGQGLASVAVFRKSDNALAARAVSDLSGHFSVDLESGLEYRFEISSGEISTSLEILVDRDLFLPVELSPPPVLSQP
ncbi:MAG: hypothetical protein GY737_15910 [Desulfobacteraceae bacterium]|nr:hypothetical protein [Desulfobacteraceae bacterium]